MNLSMNAASWVEKIPAPGRWRELTLAHGPRIATWVLALALGIQAALIVTDLTGGKALKATSVPAVTAPPPPHARLNVAAIANDHLFGSAQAQPQQGDATNAPQTSIPLVLTGIIAADDPQNGLAILGENAASAKVFAVGDTVPGGVKLHQVLGDRVILDRNGALESLMLPRQSGPPLGMAATAPPPLPTAENPIVDRMRQLIANEPSAISDIMRPQPVFAQGKQRGYRVYPGRNRQAFIRLGLRPGDLVTAINGTPLDDPARGQEVFSTLGSSSEAHVTVMRNGKQQDLTLQMSTVAQEAENLIGDGAGPGTNNNNGGVPPSDVAPPPQQGPAE
jgi:general secretion pathway protein C